MSDASLHLIALALFAEINARIDCGESRQLVLSEKGLSETEYQNEQQRWLQLLADQAQAQQWQLQQRYSAVYAQWRFRNNAPEPPPAVLRTDTLPFGPPPNQQLFTSAVKPGPAPAAAPGPSAPFTLPALRPDQQPPAKPYSPTPSRATPPYFASPASPPTVSPTPISPAPALSATVSPAFTSPSPAFTSATEAPGVFPAASRAPAPRWDDSDSDGPSFFTPEELAARRAAAAPPAFTSAQPPAAYPAAAQTPPFQQSAAQQPVAPRDWPRSENAFSAQPSFYTAAEQAARPNESASFFTTAERKAHAGDAPQAEVRPVVAETPAFFSPTTEPVVPAREQRLEPPQAAPQAFFTSAGQTAAMRPQPASPQRPEPQPMTSARSDQALPPQALPPQALPPQAPPFFASPAQPAPQPSPRGLNATGYFTAAATPTAQRTEAPPFFTSPTQPIAAAKPQRSEFEQTQAPAYFTSAGQAAAGRETSSSAEPGPERAPAYFTSAGQAAAGRTETRSAEPERKESSGYFTSAGNTTAFRPEAPPFFTTGAQPAAAPSPPRADGPAAASFGAGSPDAAAFNQPPPNAAAFNQPPPNAPVANAPSPAYFTSAGQAAARVAPLAPATGVSPAQAFSASGYFTNNPPTGAWQVPSAAAPQPAAAMAPPPLSFEQLTCLTAEIELNPSKAATAIAGYGIDQQSYQAQLQALRTRCEADPEVEQRYERLIQYYRSIVKQR